MNETGGELGVDLHYFLARAGSKGRREDMEEASVLIEGIQGGLQRKWPQCDPRFEPSPPPGRSLKPVFEGMKNEVSVVKREEQPFTWRLINSYSVPFVCLCVWGRGGCKSISLFVIQVSVCEPVCLHF